MYMIIYVTGAETIDTVGVRREGTASAEATVTRVDIMGNSHAQANEIRRFSPGRG